MPTLAGARLRCHSLGMTEARRQALLDRITIEPGKRGGRPCIRGLRMTVYDVLSYMAAGMTEAEILSDFPDLETDDIRAVLAFAAQREERSLLAS